jgi:hypothetical protein
VERLETLRDDYLKHGISVRWDVVPGVGHRGSEVIPVVQDFAASILGGVR